MKKLSIQELKEMEAPMMPGSLVIGEREWLYDSEGIVIDLWKEEDKSWTVLVDMLRTHGEWILRTINPEWVWVSELPQHVEYKLPDHLIINESRPLIKSINEEMLGYGMVKHPKIFDNLHPNAFEDLVAGIYRNHGFDVEKIGAWNQADGGIDIVAIQKSFINGPIKLIIQCKCSKNNISADPIRSLSGLLEGNRATMGVVATTSFFTEPAIEERDRIHWKIGLEDRDTLLDKLLNI